MPKIISECRELVKLCDINCSGPGFFLRHTVVASMFNKCLLCVELDQQLCLPYTVYVLCEFGILDIFCSQCNVQYDGFGIWIHFLFGHAKRDRPTFYYCNPSHVLLYDCSVQ